MNTEAIVEERRATALRAFEGYGIELEYMIVDRATLDVWPIADRLLVDSSGNTDGSVERGSMGWSNELIAHVIEIKNTRPERSLASLPRRFDAEIRAINAALASHGACLMPTGMHPWMNPATETTLWTHSDAAIYQAFDRLFDCRRHGWANLQSMHVNLPFGDDREFARLHAAIRVVLPIIPALCASSPIADGKVAPFADYRLEAYRTNATRVPSITGDVIPDDVDGKSDYLRAIVDPMFRDIAPLDDAGILRYEWLNARGAIARFDRNAIEIRLCDTQECPRADLAVAAAVAAVVQCGYDERWMSIERQRGFETPRLAAILRSCIRDADRALVDDADYLRVFGLRSHGVRAIDIWRHVLTECRDEIDRLNPAAAEPLDAILRHGPLARRLLRACGRHTERSRLHDVYRRLCECLSEDALFVDR